VIPLIWTCRAIGDVESVQRVIAQDSPHDAHLVGQRLIAAVEGLPTFPQSGRVVPDINHPAMCEVIQASYRIIYRLIHGEIHILTVHHTACLLKLEP
jgi:toxin ParE1/3/4